MSEFFRMYADEVAQQREAFLRDMDATFWLGKKGQHFDGEEWERRADNVRARVRRAEAAFDIFDRPDLP